MNPRVCPRCFCYMGSHPSLLGFIQCCCGFTKKDMKVISPIELNQHGYPTTPEIDFNLKELLYKINQVRASYGEVMTVTSGLRSQTQQDALIAAGKSNAPKSHHLVGEAVDILDEDGKLHQWAQDNEKLMEKIGLWMENRQGNWQHFQIVAPKSGSRWFNP